MAYVYRHIRKDKNEPFYIGVGGLSEFDNYRRAHNKRCRSKWWKNIVSKTDYVVEIIFDEVTNEFAHSKEQEFIELYGRLDLNSGCLCNMTNGGEGSDGFIMPEEGRQKISSSKKGKPISEATIKAVKKANTGRKKTQEEMQKLCKVIVDINTGVFYYGTREVCELYGYNRRTFMDRLNNRLVNNTPFRYTS